MSIQIWQGRHATGHLVEAARYKTEVSIPDGFIRMFYWNPHYGLGFDSASKRNEYQEYFLGFKGGRWIGLTNLTLSFTDRVEIWELQPPGSLKGLSRPLQGLLYLYNFTRCDKTIIGKFFFCERCPVGFKAGSSLLFYRISVLLQVMFPSHLGGEEA
jgi:hypothetical protein